MASPSFSVQSIIQAIIDFFRNLFGFNRVSSNTTTSAKPSQVISKTTTQSTTISKIPIITRTTPVSTVAVPLPPVTNITYHYPFKTKIPVIPMKQPVILSPSINPSIKTAKTVVKGVSLPPDFIAYAEKTQSKTKIIDIKNIPITPNVPLSQYLLKKNTSLQNERIPIAETNKKIEINKSKKTSSNIQNERIPIAETNKKISSPSQTKNENKNKNKSFISLFNFIKPKTSFSDMIRR